MKLWMGLLLTVCATALPSPEMLKDRAGEIDSSALERRKAVEVPRGEETSRERYREVVKNKLDVWDDIIAEFRKENGGKYPVERGTDLRKTANRLESAAKAVRKDLDALDTARRDKWKQAQSRIQAHLDAMRREYARVVAE